ncbi:glycosyltransferase [Kocuria arenosa]|uniref:glycosyltransferase n=1 Tax=Kocuria arenosa TaxID=3071446 RepID=UPI0034D7B553
MLISFTTRPGEGSEGGVGWEFLVAAGEVSDRRREKLIAVIDERDEQAVRTAIAQNAGMDRIELRPVKVPGFLLERYGRRSTRQTYLGWWIGARRELRSIMASEAVVNVHQVTFATMSMPPVFLGIRRAHRIWGPVGMPHGLDSVSATWGPTLTWLLKGAGRLFCRSSDTVITTNRATHDRVADLRRRVFVEPNIVVRDVLHALPSRTENQLCLVGRLSGDKRPDIAIDLMKQDRFGRHTLAVIGDGPLRKGLESRVNSEGLSDRVTFLGKLPRAEAIHHMAHSRVLIHPSESEGSPWVIGEAAAVGVPAVVFANSGAESTVELSDNGGAVAFSGTGDLAGALGNALEDVLARSAPEPTDRWSATRLPSLIEQWWK